MTCQNCGKGDRHLTRVILQQNEGSTQWLCDDCLKDWRAKHDDQSSIPLEEATPDLQRAYADPEPTDKPGY
jgi:hypothetical protein